MRGSAAGATTRISARAFAACAALATVLAFPPIGFAIDRLAGSDATDGVADASFPWLALFASSALALVALGFALLAWLRWTRTEAEFDALVATARRLAIGERGLRASPRTAALEPLAGALNRLGALNESAEEMLVDRDRQLAVLRRHAQLAYWESDRDGRLQRIEFEPSWPNAERCAPIGRLLFEEARPLERDAWQAALEALAARRPYADLVLERRTADGGTIRVIESGEPRFAADGSFIGYCGTRRRIAASVTLRHSALQPAVETGAQPAVVVSRGIWPLKIVALNAAARALVDAPDAADAPTTIERVLDPDDGDAARELQKAVTLRAPLRQRATIRDRYGERAEAIARLEPIDGGTDAFVLVLDVQEAQQERLHAAAEAAETLRTKVRELERRAHQLDSFAWSVSHDLRAPLRAVDGFARLVLEDPASGLGDVARAHLQRVLDASARMERMIDALMALARSTTQPMQPMRVDLGRLAQDIAHDLMRSHPERSVMIHCEPSLVVDGDPDLLRILLQNLLENAWKYTANRDAASIRFDASTDARGHTLYCVSDNGRGFDATNADRLFAPFQRLHPEAEVPGTGIGLAIARQVVQRHGGTIWADSAPGEGSRFYFTIGEAGGTTQPV